MIPSERSDSDAARNKSACPPVCGGGAMNGGSSRGKSPPRITAPALDVAFVAHMSRPVQSEVKRTNLWADPNGTAGRLRLATVR